MLTTFLVYSPLEQFEVVSFINLNAPVLGYFNLSLTNLGLYAIVTGFIVIGLHIISNNDAKLVPNN